MQETYSPADQRQANDDSEQPRFRGFVKMMRSDDIYELIEAAPLAFALAAIIALRARFLPGVSMKGLNPGEALIGDFARYGMTRQQYRTAIRCLETHGFVTTRKTNLGTIPRLINTRLFDVLNVTANEQVNQPTNHRATSKQPLTKNGKKGKKVRRKTKTAVSQAHRRPSSVKEVFDCGRRIGSETEVILRFIRYNNHHGWKVKSWRAALLGFRDSCTADFPASEVPPNWVPVIE